MIIATFSTAILIELIGTYISVSGLTALFGMNWVIAAMAISLDIGKMIVVSLVYTHWRTLPKLMRAYALAATAITMTITSAGSSSYLAAEFQKAVVGTQEGQLKIQVLKDEQQKLETRKKQIDDGIASIPDRYSANQKIRLMNQFKEEQKQVTARLDQISKDLPSLQVSQISVEAKAGPILYIAKAFNITIEEAVKWVILMIIFVFDPLAVFLVIAGNFLLSQRKKQGDEPPPPEKEKDDAPLPVAPAAVVPAVVAAAAASVEPPVVVETREMKAPETKDLVVEAPVVVEPVVVAETATETVVTPVVETPVEETPVMVETVTEAPEEPPTEPVAEPVAEKVEQPAEVVEQQEPAEKAAEPEQVEKTIDARVTLQELMFIKSLLNKPPEDEAPAENPEREQITKSSLGIVEPDPKTITDSSAKEVGFKTGVFKTGVYRSGR